VTGRSPYESQFDTRNEQENLVYPKRPDRLRDLPNGHRTLNTDGVKRPESEANHSFPPRTEVRTTQLQLINIIIRYLLLLLLLCHGTENASNKKKTHSSKYHVMQSNGQYRCVVKLSRVF